MDLFYILEKKTYPMKKNKKKIEEKEKPKVHPELEGFDVKINSFGEIISTHSIEKINEFLNKNVADKKLKDRDGFKQEEDEVE
jgi:hypothetical protein